MTGVRRERYHPGSVSFDADDSSIHYRKLLRITTNSNKFNSKVQKRMTYCLSGTSNENGAVFEWIIRE